MAAAPYIAIDPPLILRKDAHKPSKVYVDVIVFRRQVHVTDSA